MTIGMGFWGATGEVRVSECGIKDADGNVVFSKKFDSVEGLKLMGGMADEANKGTSWGIVGEVVAEPETPDVDRGIDNLTDNAEQEENNNDDI